MEVSKIPYGDRTGPWGRGPMTGRGAGYCAGYDMPGAMSPGWGRGFGRGSRRGMGRGRGWGRGAPRPYFPEPAYPQEYARYSRPDPEAEKAYLTDLVQSLEEELKDVKKRLSELADKKEG